MNKYYVKNGHCVKKLYSKYVNGSRCVKIDGITYLSLIFIKIGENESL